MNKFNDYERIVLFHNYIKLFNYNFLHTAFMRSFSIISPDKINKWFHEHHHIRSIDIVNPTKTTNLS